MEERGFRPATSRLNASSGKSRGPGQERDAGLATRPVTATAAPEEGVAVRVPVSGCLRDGLDDLVPGLEAAAGESQRAQHLPPRLDRGEVGGDRKSVV